MDFFFFLIVKKTPTTQQWDNSYLTYIFKTLDLLSVTCFRKDIEEHLRLWVFKVIGEVFAQGD